MQGVDLRRGVTNPWIVVALAIVLLIAINLGYRAIVTDLRETLDSQHSEHLAGLAETFAGSLDAGLVRSTIDEELFDPEAFISLRELSVRFATVNRLVSATILDTTWQDLFAEERDSLGRMVYSLLDREGQWALRSGLTWVSATFRWEESYYRSAAAPVEDPITGEWLAIARIEVDARHYGALDSLEQMAWWIHALSTVLTISLVGLFLWHSRATQRWETELLRSEKLIGLGRLSATIAHEIKNPLSIIKATAQRLSALERQGQGIEKREELLRYIPEEVDRLNHILTRYLRVGEMEKSIPIAVDVSHELPLWLKSIEGTRRIDSDITKTPPVLCDREAPRQVVINLVKNALEASGDNARVQVEWTPDGRGYGVLRVKDHGPGIPAKLRAEVFEPFRTTKATGSGLGLYAVKTLVERDGGDVRIEDNDGGGAVFIVRWKLSPNPDM
jgi:signal transduction histidine kinase